jgi:UDP-2-acetamido-3-amino-2,3-dideoxy-glucuronate N-acetyltransferase
MPFAYKQHCVIFDDAQIGTGTRIGNFVLIRDNTIIGENCLIGSYVDIEGDVRIGNFVSLQSGCYLTRGVIIEDEVFCGPRVMTMNDKPISYRRASLQFERRGKRLVSGNYHRRKRARWSGLRCHPRRP